MRKLLAILSLSCLALPALTQEPFTQAFAPITFNNGTTNGNDVGIDVALDAAGNVYVLGSTETAGEGINYLLRKYDNNGNFVYNREVHSANLNDDIPVAMAVDNVGNVYITGSTFIGATPVAYLTAKFNTAGVLQYAVPYHLNPGNASQTDQANDIGCDQSGNCYVVGESFSGTTRDYVIQRYSGNTGTISWTTTKNGPGDGADRGRGITVKNGSVYVTGVLFVNGSDTDFGTGRYNAGNGAQQWFTQWTAQLANDNAAGFDIDVFPSGRVVTTGERRLDTNQNKGMTATCIWHDGTTGATLFPTPPNEGLSQILNFGNNNQAMGGVKVVAGVPNTSSPQGSDTAYLVADGVVNTLNNNPQVMLVSSFSTDNLLGNGSGRGGWDINTFGAGSADDVAADSIGAGYGLGTGVFDINSPTRKMDINLFRAGGGTPQEGYYAYDGPNGGDDKGGAVALDSDDDVWIVGTQKASNGKNDIVILKLIQRPGITFEDYHLFKGQTLEVDAAHGVMANDVGSKGGTVSFDADQVNPNPPLVGTVELNTDGSFNYTPPPTFAGETGFNYTITKAPYPPISSSGLGIKAARIHVHPNIQELQLPATAPGGTQVVGKVIMDGNEPQNSLAGTSSAMPAGLAIFPGQWAPSGGSNEAFFTFYAQAVVSDTNVTITVARGGTSASDTVTITPGGGILTLALNPTSVTGGENTTGTVTMANANGADINLTTNTAFIQVPATLNIPAASTSGNFIATTTPVNSQVVRQVIATTQDGISSRTASLTLKPAPVLTTLGISPSSVHGGQNATGTVTLSSGAAAGGTQVMLSDNSGSLTTPPSVVVAQNSLTGTFTIGTLGVASTSTRQVTASLNAVTKTANITLVPSPALSTLVVSPSVVTGGQSTTGTVTLSANATAGSVVVGVSDNSGSISTPPNATVTQNTSSKNFGINTSAVLSSNTRQITATLLGVTKTANLALHPAPKLASLGISPSTVKGGNSTTGTVTYDVPAGVGGNSTSITDNSSSITTPSSVTVLNGNTTRTFTITTSAVGANATRTVTATRNGISKTANLTLTP